MCGTVEQRGGQPTTTLSRIHETGNEGRGRRGVPCGVGDPEVAGAEEVGGVLAVEHGPRGGTEEANGEGGGSRPEGVGTARGG